jgi:hypothetical protein
MASDRCDWFNRSTQAHSAVLPYNGVMNNPKDRQTLRALGTAIGFILVLSITGSVMAQDQRGTDALPLVVKPISGRDNPLHVEQSTEWPVFYVALGIGVLQLIVFGIQSYLLWDTVLSSNLPKIIVRRIVIESPNIDNRPVTQPFRQNDKLRGRFTFINVGRRKATIAETYSMFFITDKALPMNPLYDDAGTYPRLNITLPPGWSDGTPIVGSINIDTIPSEPH